MLKKLSFIRQLSLIVLAVVVICSFMVSSDLKAAYQPLTVTRGGTGLTEIPEGYFVVGNTIDNMVATSSISMDMDSGAITIGEIVINGIASGDLIIQGDLGIATSSPKENMVITDTGSSTIYIQSTGAFGGNIVFSDSDGGGCSEIYALNGIIQMGTITCPY